MKIIRDKTANMVPLKKIKDGDTFEYNDKIYLKMKSFVSSGKTLYDCVDLEDCQPGVFQNLEMMVIPLTCELIVKY